MLQEIWLCATYGGTDDNSSGNIRCQKNILDTLNYRFGSEKAKNLISAYEDNYWTTGDFENCAKLGINCIRLPIWYRNLVDENGNWYDNAFDKIDWFVETAGRYGIYVIIDMHGTYGSQNGSHNSGIYGGSTNQQKKDNSNLFFGTDASTNQAKYLDMWLKIAQHYKDNPVVAGYDLLNEPMADYMNATDITGTKAERLSTLWNVYDKSMDSVPIGSIKITPPNPNATWSDYVTKTIDLYEPLKEGKHTIYLKFVNDSTGNVVNLKDFTLISSYGNVKLENVATGKHTVTVQATLNEQVSKGTTSNEV